MAEMIGIDKSTLADYEAGKNRPTEKTVELIEEFLGFLGSEN